MGKEINYRISCLGCNAIRPAEIYRCFARTRCCQYRCKGELFTVVTMSANSFCDISRCSVMWRWLRDSSFWNFCKLLSEHEASNSRRHVCISSPCREPFQFASYFRVTACLMKAYGGMEVQLQLFLTCALDATEFSASHPYSFTLGTKWIRQWAGSRTGFTFWSAEAFTALPENRNTTSSSSSS